MPGLELRVLRRDEYPEVMDRYLTNGSRSIPIVIALDEEFRELGHWGPRPRELQAWVMANRASIPKAELYPRCGSGTPGTTARPRCAKCWRRRAGAAGSGGSRRACRVACSPAQNIHPLPTEKFHPSGPPA